MNLRWFGSWNSISELLLFGKTGSCCCCISQKRAQAVGARGREDRAAAALQQAPDSAGAVHRRHGSAAGSKEGARHGPNNMQHVHVCEKWKRILIFIIEAIKAAERQLLSRAAAAMRWSDPKFGAKLKKKRLESDLCNCESFKLPK